MIVRFKDDALERTPGSSARVRRACRPRPAPAILSGFNALPAGTLPDRPRRARPLAAAWRAAGLRLVHLELGDFTDPAACPAPCAAVAGSATCLGLSLSELLGSSRTAARSSERPPDLGRSISA